MKLLWWFFCIVLFAMFLLVINFKTSACNWIPGTHFEIIAKKISLSMRMWTCIFAWTFRKNWFIQSIVMMVGSRTIHNENENQETSSVIHFHENCHSIIIYITWNCCLNGVYARLICHINWKNRGISFLSFCETKHKCWINGEYWTANMLYLHTWFVSMKDNDIEWQSKWKYVSGSNSTKYTKSSTVKFNEVIEEKTSKVKLQNYLVLSKLWKQQVCVRVRIRECILKVNQWVCALFAFHWCKSTTFHELFTRLK